MKLIRKVEWEGLKQLYKVEWKLVHVDLPLPRYFYVDIDERLRFTMSHVEDDGEEYWFARHWYQESIDQVDDHTRKIINTVKEVARETVRKMEIAEKLSGEYIIDID